MFWLLFMQSTFASSCSGQIIKYKKITMEKTMIWIFVGGLACLVLGAELLVRGASKLALSFGISPLVVGLTIVAFGTSAPEVAVAVGAVIEGRTDLAMGNVVGSNIFNVLFILGLSALITPLIVNTQIIRQEVPIMIGASLLLLVLGLDGNLGFTDSAILLGLMVVYTVFLLIQSRKETKATEQESVHQLESKSSKGAHWIVQVLFIAGGLALLVLGSEWLVSASVAFAKSMGVSDLVIGLTIVAAGTSMPEVATSLMAAIRKERDIAIGNVVGSSIFNILACLGIAGVVSSEGLSVAPAVFNFDIWVMLAVAFACLPVFVSGRQIARWEGGVFLAYYAAYTAYLILSAQAHDALQPFSTVMMSYVLPITVVTLLVVLLRPNGKKAEGASP
jgi:cation:H+ antiporter